MINSDINYLFEQEKKLIDEAMDIMYYLGISYSELMCIPTHFRRRFIERFAEIKERENKELEDAYKIKNLK